MRKKVEIKDYKSGSGKMERWICWKCDKCNQFGFNAVANDVEDLTKDKKKCECEG